MIKADFKCKKTTLVRVTAIVCLAMSHFHTSVSTDKVQTTNTDSVHQMTNARPLVLAIDVISAHFRFLLLSGNNWCSMDSVRPSGRTPYETAMPR